jgi:hypothetical protein
MRLSFLAALAAATALIPAAASAQQHDRGGWHNNGGNRGGDHQNRGASRPAAPARPSANHAPQARPQFQHGARPERPAGFDRRPALPGRPHDVRRPEAGRPAPARPDGNWRAQAGGSHFGDRPDRNDWNRDRRPGSDPHWDRGPGRPDGHWNGNRGDQRSRWGHGRGDQGRFDRNWRHDNRYDWRDYRTRNRGAYHLPRYYAPYGWDYGYRRFGIGFRLDSVLFGSNYWISDPYYYRLPPAYGPYRWVRYYNDALLVDIDTGQVVDVVYDIFW